MSYIEDFTQYSLSVCEAPVHFHKWTAVWTLAAACGRRYHLPFHGNPLYPNMFLILVGPAGLVQKSTIAGIGVKLLRAAGFDNIYEDRLTRGYLGKRMAQMDKLQGQVDVIIHAPELRTAFSDFVLREGLMEWLTRMWDCPEAMGDGLKENLREGFEGTLHNICINMIGCSTPQWLVTGLRQDELGGGFSARTIYVNGEEPHTIMRYRKLAPSSSAAAYDRMVRFLATIREGEGVFDVEPGAADAWYTLRHAVLKRKDVDVRIRDYVNRSHIHVLKLAALLTLAEDDYIITSRHVEAALQMLLENEPSMLMAMRGVSASKLDALADEIIEIVEANKGECLRSVVTRTLSARRRSVTRQTREQVIEMLVEADRIEVFEEQRVEGKRKAVIYRIKRKEGKDAS